MLATATAQDRLRRLTGDPAAAFRPGQAEAIADLVEDRARVLCVQRTGWGKSAVYFVATSLLRERGAGPTLIVSPLLALMRNQLAAAGALGLRAATVNSTNREDWARIRDQLAADELDLLLISPERLNNPRFREEMLPRFAEAVGLLVVDEAHCVSDWGHDFRPDYRRVKDMLARLGDDVAVLATTATANDRVVGDVLEQLGAGGGELRSYRGPLARSSLRLEVVELPRPAERLAWLAETLPSLPGSGIVYTLTKRDAEQVASFLAAQGISALAYSGDQETEDRVAAEERLLRNDVKALVATSALGMGYDKADLGFVVHFQAPGSVVSYYQQVGRAGRGVPHADAILLRGAEDARIQDFFIEQAFPGEERVLAVLAELDAAGAEGRTSRELMATVNLGSSRIEAMLKVLDVEGAVARAGSRWTSVPGRTWTYERERYAQVTALRRAEQAAMASFGADGRCLMRVLEEELDDPGPSDCGRCAVCTSARWATPPAPDLVERAQRHLRTGALPLDAKKMAPGPDGAMRKIPEGSRIGEGWALARIGDGGWWPAVERGLRAGRAPDEVVTALADAVRRAGLAGGGADAGGGPSTGGGAGAGGGPSAGGGADADSGADAGGAAVRWLSWVPSRANGELLADLAARVAAELGVPAVGLLERVADRPPQREMANAVQQAANVRGAFRVVRTVPAGAGLLLDDRRASGWTLAMAGGQLRLAGAEEVRPLTLATTF